VAKSSSISGGLFSNSEEVRRCHFEDVDDLFLLQLFHFTDFEMADRVLKTLQMLQALLIEAAEGTCRCVNFCLRVTAYSAPLDGEEI
jgi:hypothetical protein